MQPRSDGTLTVSASGIRIRLQVAEMHVHALRRVQVERPVLGGVTGVWLRVRVGRKQADLDRQLAEGADPSNSPELSFRAAQLTSPRRRAGFASGLESVVAEALSKRRAINPPVQLQRAAILAAEDELLELAGALRSPARCRPHAAGIVAFLLCDAASPLYYSDARATPAQLARAAIAGFTSS
jgi:hypothetical protein